MASTRAGIILTVSRVQEMQSEVTARWRNATANKRAVWRLDTARLAAAPVPAAGNDGGVALPIRTPPSSSAEDDGGGGRGRDRTSGSISVRELTLMSTDSSSVNKYESVTHG